MERPIADVAPSRGIETLLLEWQSSGDTLCLESLITTITPFLERIAAQTLRRHGIHDTSAIDDTTELVFDHLRRLPLARSDERSVVKFDPARPRCRCARGSAAKAYLRRLTHDRAIDVTRARRRRDRHATPLSQLGDTETITLARAAILALEDDSEPVASNSARLNAAIDRLEPRLRTVIELLLQGKSQVTIAHAINACEGTVSRLRVKAIAELRRLLAE